MQKINHSNSDRISLFELFEIFWRGKLLVFVFLFVGLFLSVIYAFTAKEEWTSKAQIIPPKVAQLGTYLDVLRGYYRFADFGANEKSEDSIIKIEDSINYAYTSMITMLNSANNKYEYLLNSEYYKRNIVGNVDDLSNQRLLLVMVDKNFQIKETNKGKQDSYDISFLAETAGDAQKNLQGYIESVNELVLNKLFSDLHIQINERILTLEHNAANFKLESEQTRNNNILALKQSIEMAKNAGIKEYNGPSMVTRVDLSNSIITDFSSSEDMFLLGEKYLMAQLSVMESSPIIYQVNYYKTLGNIKGLKQLLDYEVKGNAFEYTLTPSLPLTKDKPQKSLVLILGAFLGGVFGCCIVFIQFLVANRKKY